MVFLNPKTVRRALLILALAGFLSFLYGVFFYHAGQFAETNLFLWPFVPDCPLAALLVAAVFLLSYFNRKSSVLSFLAATASLKYSLWTLAVLFAFSDYFFAPQRAFLYSVLFIGHSILLLESLLLAGTFDISSAAFFFSTLFLFLSDFSDYFLSTNPAIPATPHQLFLVGVFTFFLSLFSILAHFHWSKKHAKFFKSWRLFRELHRHLYADRKIPGLG